MAAENRNTCQLCGYQTARKNKLKQHQLSAHEGRKYKCNQCDYQTKKTSNLIDHQKSLHEETKYQCDFRTAWKCYVTAHQQPAHKGHGKPDVFQSEEGQVVPPIRINLSHLQPQIVAPIRINLQSSHDVSIVHGDDTVEIFPEFVPPIRINLTASQPQVVPPFRINLSHLKQQVVPPLRINLSALQSSHAWSEDENNFDVEILAGTSLFSSAEVARHRPGCSDGSRLYVRRWLLF